ncbi:tetratricopeptide repeat protein [Mucilaginibacter sp. cycad4]|uniref:tetratricopeptide repeat protein n=1 Tax=Mucilaginibacter sp. cycad4 TaxID=3342096 RepID=UPI002AAAE87C|nr:tetratricopeptide repeat protein [Mucilaginibacter gossypii]WPV01759.1 tetratricopeptide repeat protein [Mucilaginibacter gossypii]
MRDNTMHIVEHNTSFSDSLLWKIHRDYYTNAGIKAWRDGDVPHYITNNSAVAAAYAELIFAFLRDRVRLFPAQKETIYLLELGTGSGRLAYHLLTRLETLCEGAAFEVPPFTYIMSDLSANNIAFWKNHPKLKKFTDKNWLDFAFFDVKCTTELNLQMQGLTLKKGHLQTPLLVIANYLWDSVPQDLFYITGRNVYDGETVLSVPEPHDDTSTPTQLMQQIEVTYHSKLTDAATRYAEKELNLLLDHYRQNIKDSWVLFPHIAIGCLERLHRLSAEGFLLISADKGRHQIQDLDDKMPPQIIKHAGGFSLNVNFHAIDTYFTAQGALSLTTRQNHQSISICTLLALKVPEDYAETKSAFRNQVERFGPDDFFRLKRHFVDNCYDMNLMQMESCIRLSCFDTNIFKNLLPCLLYIAEEAKPDEIANFKLLLYEVWNNYYSMGEEGDLAFDIGSVFYQLCCYQDALFFFGHSLEAHPPDTAVLYNIAGCYYVLKNDEQALKFIARTFALDPNHKGAASLIESMLKQTQPGVAPGA